MGVAMPPKAHATVSLERATSDKCIAASSGKTIASTLVPAASDTLALADEPAQGHLASSGHPTSFDEFRSGFLQKWRAPLQKALQAGVGWQHVFFMPIPLADHVQRRFMDTVRQNSAMKTCEPAYHGTAHANLKNINKEGLLVGGEGVRIAHGAAHGTGIYVAKMNLPSLSKGFADREELLICAVVRSSSAVHEHADAMIISDKSCVAPLFLASKQVYKSVSEARKAGLSGAEILQMGFSASEMVKAGYNAAQLREAGYRLADVKQVCSAEELLHAGFPAHQLRKERFTIDALKQANYSDSSILGAGYKASELAGAGFNASQLRQAGYSMSDSACWFFPALELFLAGYPADDLRDAGFSITALKDAGYSDSSILRAGYSIADLRQNGYFASELRGAGVNLLDLKKFYREDELVEALTDHELRAAHSAESLWKLTPKRLPKAASSVFRAYELFSVGFQPEMLQQAGFAIGDVINACGLDAALCAGYSQADFMAHGQDEKTLRAALRRLEKNGYLASDLKRRGFSAKVMRGAYNEDVLATAGFSAVELRSVGISAHVLQSAGYAREEVLKAGYSAEDVLRVFKSCELQQGEPEQNPQKQFLQCG